MKYNETTFERDGKAIYRFDFGGGCSQEADSPAVAEIIRRTNRESRPEPARSAHVGGTMPVAETKEASDMLDAAHKMLEKTNATQQMPLVRQDAALPTKDAGSPELADSDWAVMEKLVKPGKWDELFDLSLSSVAMSTAPRKDVEIPFLPGLYSGRGGRQLKKRIKDEATRKDAYDEALSSQFTDMELVMQGCMGYLCSLNAIQFIEGVKDRNSPLHTVLELMMRLNGEMRSIMLTDAKLRGGHPHQLHIGNAGQVFVGAPKDGEASDMRNPQRNPLTKIGEAPEDSYVSREDQAQE